MTTGVQIPAHPVPWLLPVTRPILGHRVTLAPLAAAFLVLGVAVLLSGASDWWLIPIGLIAPDLAFLAGVGQAPPAPGVMPGRAVPFYNAAHRAAPAAVTVLVTAALGWHAALVLSLAWLSHIVWDRAVGYGLRRPDGSIAAPFAPHQRAAMSVRSRPRQPSDRLGGGGTR